MAKNFARSTVRISPSPALSGLSLEVEVGHGTRFETSGQLTLCPEGADPTPENAEIVTVSGRTGDLLTLSARAQEGTTAKAIDSGWQVIQGITAAEFDNLLPKGTTDLATSLIQLLRVDIPDDGSPSSEWPDRLVFFYIDPDDGAVRAGYFNELGELRARAAKASTVAFRAMGHPNNTTQDIVQVTDSGQTTVYAGFAATGVTLTVNLAAPNIPVDKVRTTDATPVTNSTVLVTDDVMQGALTAGTWIVEGTVIYDCAAAADLKLRINYSGTVTSSAISAPVLTTAATSSATNQGNFAAREANSNFAAGGFGVGSLAAVTFRGVLVVSTGGTLSIQYAQNQQDASDLTVRAGSHLSYRKRSS